MRRRTVVFAAGVLLLGAAAGVASQGGKYSVSEPNTTAGGGKSTSVSYTAESSITIAQPEGSANSASYSVEALIEDQNTTGLDWVQYELGE